MRYACWIIKATDAHSEYYLLIFVIFINIIVFPRQQWLRERIPMVHHTYIACIVKNHIGPGVGTMDLTMSEKQRGMVGVLAA
jgi:hypothetical protein